MAQQDHPSKGDWVTTVKENLQEVEIAMDLDSIAGLQNCYQKEGKAVPVCPRSRMNDVKSRRILRRKYKLLSTVNIRNGSSATRL